MKYSKITALCLIGITTFSSCKDDDNTTDNNEEIETYEDSDLSEIHAAFAEFDDANTTIYLDGDNVVIESNGLPNHTSPYWQNSNSLYIDPIVADENQMSPGTISEENYSLTVPVTPELASSSTSTGLGAIGIAVSGVPIFNDQEGPNITLSAQVASGFDYAGGHMGPTGYHYHLESSDIPENTILSHDDDNLVGIISDGFFLYGRKCNSTGSYPTDLDVSGGHTTVTQHTISSEYHYHIINEIFENTYYILFPEDYQGTPNGIQ